MQLFPREVIPVLVATATAEVVVVVANNTILLATMTHTSGTVSSAATKAGICFWREVSK